MNCRYLVPICDSSLIIYSVLGWVCFHFNLVKFFDLFLLDFYLCVCFLKAFFLIQGHKIFSSFYKTFTVFHFIFKSLFICNWLLCVMWIKDFIFSTGKTNCPSISDSSSYFHYCCAVPPLHMSHFYLHVDCVLSPCFLSLANSVTPVLRPQCLISVII